MYKVQVLKEQPYHTEGTVPPASAVTHQLREALDSQGFTADVSWLATTGRRAKYQYQINLATIRLQEAKEYCGNHPGPCKIRPGFHQPHKRLRYLEGGDWVRLNDLVNNVLDTYSLSANVSSAHVVTRIETRRRIQYQMNTTGRFADDWTKHGPDIVYKDYCGKIAPPSTAPRGTPALPLEQAIY